MHGLLSSSSLPVSLKRPQEELFQESANKCGFSKPFLELFCPLSVVPSDVSSPVCRTAACYVWEPLGTLIALTGRAAGSRLLTMDF